MPTSCSRLSRPRAISSGASSWQGMHHDAQTLTTLTWPLKIAGSSPGTEVPPLVRPSNGGNAVCGAGWPINADGIREGSPVPSRYQYNATNAANAITGSTISNDQRWGIVSVVEGSLILVPA